MPKMQYNKYSTATHLVQWSQGNPEVALPMFMAGKLSVAEI